MKVIIMNNYINNRLMHNIIAFLLISMNWIFAENYMVCIGPDDQSRNIGTGNIGADNIVHWAGDTVTYYLNDNGAGDGLSTSQTASAVNSAFDAWEDVSTATIVFDSAGFTSSEWAVDGKNVHFWAESAEDSIFTDWGMNAGVYAYTIISINSNEEFTDVDIVFNGKDHTWNVDGSDTDIQAVSTHEIGHMLGPLIRTFSLLFL